MPNVKKRHPGYHSERVGAMYDDLKTYRQRVERELRAEIEEKVETARRKVDEYVYEAWKEQGENISAVCDLLGTSTRRTVMDALERHRERMTEEGDVFVSEAHHEFSYDPEQDAVHVNLLGFGTFTTPLDTWVRPEDWSLVGTTPLHAKPAELVEPDRIWGRYLMEPGFKDEKWLPYLRNLWIELGRGTYE